LTRHIRATNKPNVVVQDIDKQYLLCHTCEELFSAKERWFAKNIFHPYLDKKQSLFMYDKNLTYFIVSLSWRSLYSKLAKFSTDPQFSQEKLLILFQAEQVMREYLLGKRSNIGNVENHIFFLDRVQSSENIDISLHPNVAMHRTLLSYTTYNGKTIFTVSNLMGIMIVTFYCMDPREKWIRTKVANDSGFIEAKNQHVESVIGNEIECWMRRVATSNNDMSETQRQKILERVFGIGERIKNYPIFQDWNDDDSLR